MRLRLSRPTLAGVAFEHNTYVRVVGGEHIGDSGSLVSIEELGDDPVYLVELESNKDALVPQSCLRVVEA
jgi:ribosomal protein S4E